MIASKCWFGKMFALIIEKEDILNAAAMEKIENRKKCNSFWPDFFSLFLRMPQDKIKISCLQMFSFFIFHFRK
jgi:hypothetical protein